MVTDINTLLDSYNSNTLWEMAREARLPDTTGKKLKKDELLHVMRQHYFQPERIQKAYQQLTKLERAVVDRLLLHEGQLSTRLFKRELIRAELVTEAPAKEAPKGLSTWQQYQGWTVYGRSVNHIGQPQNLKSTIFEDVIARLTLYGLVFSEAASNDSDSTTYKFQYHPGETLIIPSFVRQHLPKPEPVAQSSQTWQPDFILHGDPQLMLRDLYLYWDTVRRSAIALIQSGYVGKRGLKQLNDALLTPDPNLDKARQEDQAAHLYLLRQILQEWRLVTAKGSTLQIQTKAGQVIPELWQKSEAEQVKAVLDVWRKLPVPFTLNTREVYYVEPNMRQACDTLLAALAQLPTATWIEAEDLLVNLQNRNENFFFPQRSRVQGSNSYYFYGNPKELIPKMDKLEQTFVAQIMAGFIFQLGLVELGFAAPPDKPTAWQAFRLTPLGTAVLHNKPLETTVAAGQIIIQPNFQILAMGPVSLSLLAQLDLFAERQKVDRHAFEYHLSRESIYAAQQVGYAVDQVEAFLETATHNELPQNVRRSLAEWAAHHERIVFRSGVTLLQAANEALLTRLQDADATGKLLARAVGAAVALVKSNRQPQLVSALQETGIFPAISGANPEAADKSVMVHEDGRIQPIHAVPSLHLRGRLARFTEEVNGGWQLTATAVQRAAGSKKKTQQILDELGKLHRGHLPKTIVEQVKAWGGYYGSASVGTLTLLEFRDQETLAELLQLPELHDMLRPFPAGNRALATVEKSNLTAVRQILTRLGVQLTTL